jgi:GTP-binding protein HflX
VVVVDTVGFVSRLPHTLVDAFKATLEEVAGSDLLVHVVDGSVMDTDRRVADVLAVLDEIGAAAVPMVTALNKADLVGNREPSLTGGVWVSAKTGAGLENLIDRLSEALGVEASPIEVLLPASQGKTRAWLYEVGAVLDEQIADDGQVSLTVRADDRLLHQLRRTPRVLLRNLDPVPRISSLPN